MAPRGRWRPPLLALALLSGSAALGADEPLRLETYVDIVLRAHPAMRAGRALEDLGEAERRSSRLIADPTFEASIGRARPADAGAGRATETGFTVSQSLPWLPARRAAIEGADRAAEVRRAEAARVRWDVRSDARAAFFRLQEARALAEVLRGAEADARSLLELVERRTEVGESRETDRIRARVEWLKQQRELRAAERDAAAAEAILRALAVDPLPRPLALAGELPTSFAVSDLAGTSLAGALDAGPEVLRARAESTRDRSLLSFARRSRVPDLDLSLFHQEELDKESYGLSLGVVLPLWNGRRGDIAKASAESSLATAQVERVRVTLQAELESRRRDVEVSAVEVASLLSDVGPAAAESLRIARLLFEEGETSLLDLLDAQRTARETRREEIRARHELARALNELQRLLGSDLPEGRPTP